MICDITNSGIFNEEEGFGAISYTVMPLCPSHLVKLISYNHLKGISLNFRQISTHK